MFVSSFISLPVSKENARLTHDMLHTEKPTKNRDSKIFLRYLLDDNINPIKLCPKFYHKIITGIQIIHRLNPKESFLPDNKYDELTAFLGISHRSYILVDELHLQCR